MIEFCSFSCKKSNKKENEDRVFVNNKILVNGEYSGEKKDKLIALVCDGVGGNLGGAKCANLVASSFLNYKIKSAQMLTRHLNMINQAVTACQKEDPSIPNMATTIAGILLINDGYLIFNLGDSRVYELKNGKLFLKTKDHIFKENILSRYIGGYGNACFPSIIKGRTINEETYFLICSDGVYKSISGEKIKEIINDSSTSINEKSRAIMKLSQKKDSDDASAILIRHTHTA